MSRLPALKPKEVLRALVRAGFFVEHQRGSHVRLRHPFKRHLRVTIPYHARFDLPPSVVHSIINQTEFSRDEFLDFL